MARADLIPRYNWDFGLADLRASIGACFGRDANHTGVWVELFGKAPLLTTSGRASLFTLLKSLGLPAKSGVGVPLFCCSVVFDTIREAGMTPVFLDIDPEDYNVSATDVDKKRKRLSAIVAVHMFGHPADVESISAAGAGVPVIEDCAQSLFSTLNGRYTGFRAEASFFSFRSGKYISAGEGSAIFCKDRRLHEEVRRAIERYPSWGRAEELVHCASTFIKSSLYKRPWYGTVGYPIGRRLDRRLNLTAKSGVTLRQAARSDLATIGARIGTFRERVERQRRNARVLLENVRLPGVSLPGERIGCRTNFYQFAIRFSRTDHRDIIAEYLFSKGIDAARYLDDIVDYATRWHDYKGDCPTAESCSKTVLVVPHYYTLSDRDLGHIVDCLNAGTRHLESCA